MDLEALVTDELREEIAGYALEWFEVDASSRRPPHARVSVTLPDGASRRGLVHRRRPDRRRLPGDQRRDRRRRRRSASSRSARSPRARTRSARSRSCVEVDGSTGAGPGRLDRHHRRGRARLRARAVGRRRALARRTRRSGCPRAPPADVVFTTTFPGPRRPRRGRAQAIRLLCPLKGGLVRRRTRRPRPASRAPRRSGRARRRCRRCISPDALYTVPVPRAAIEHEDGGHARSHPAQGLGLDLAEAVAR